MPVSSDDDPCSVPLDLPLLRLGELLVGAGLLLISEDIISFNSFICRLTLSLRSEKYFRRLTMSPLIFVKRISHFTHISLYFMLAVDEFLAFLIDLW
jgi:hypothetical protein